MKTVVKSRYNHGELRMVKTVDMSWYVMICHDG